MLVSILTPVYNVAEPYLRQAVESMLAQTLREIEIVLVDDGSTDPRCGEVCAEYAARDGRVTLLHRPNGGPSAARNSAIGAARGEYITFVDADDWLEPDTCERLYETARREDLTLLLFGAVQEFAGHSAPYRDPFPDGARFEGEGLGPLRRALFDYRANIADPWGKLVKRAFLEQHPVRYDESLRLGEGLDFWLRVFERAERAMFAAEPRYHYRYTSASITHGYNEANIHNTLAAFQKVDAHIAGSEGLRDCAPLLQERLLYFILAAAVSGFFHPDNPEPYRVKRDKYRRLLETSIVRAALRDASPRGLSPARRAAHLLVKHHIYFPLGGIARVRKFQVRKQ